MVELNIQLIRPALGTLTGFESASSATGWVYSPPPFFNNLSWQFHGWEGLCQAETLV
jgi:hypothetical protein